MIQAYLRGGGTLDTLLAERGVSAKRHGDFPNLVQLKYHMVNSPMGDPLVQECRGIILDEARDWEVVARPFDKFFNHGEGHAAQLDWGTARVQEKVDGSLMTIYWYADSWRVASSGLPDARGKVGVGSGTFEKLFYEAWRNMGFRAPRDRDRAWMFELTSKHNRVVISHAEPRLTLIGVRAKNGEEEPVSSFPEYHPVREFPLQSVADVEATFAKLSPLAQEGYVIVDGAFRRIKVKHPGYVAIHHLKDGFGPRRMVEIIRMGETSELLAHFPEWREEFDEATSKFNELAAAIEAEYASIRDIPVQKDFALRAKDMGMPAALFALRNGRVTSAKSFLAGMQIRALMEALGLRDTEPEVER